MSQTSLLDKLRLGSLALALGLLLVPVPRTWIRTTLPLQGTLIWPARHDATILVTLIWAALVLVLLLSERNLRGRMRAATFPIALLAVPILVKWPLPRLDHAFEQQTRAWAGIDVAALLLGLYLMLALISAVLSLVGRPPDRSAQGAR